MIFFRVKDLGFFYSTAKLVRLFELIWVLLMLVVRQIGTLQKKETNVKKKEKKKKEEPRVVRSLSMWLVAFQGYFSMRIESQDVCVDGERIREKMKVDWNEECEYLCTIDRRLATPRICDKSQEING